jgi:hypothetical protein
MPLGAPRLGVSAPLTTLITGRSITHASGGTFRVGLRAPRLSERWPADPLLALG